MTRRLLSTTFRALMGSLLCIHLTTSADEKLDVASPIHCRAVTNVHDGDTLTCHTTASQRGFVVRFAGIDAPETGQMYWRVARDRLKELAASGTLADCYKQDQYGRQVCRLRSPKGNDLADAMIGEGLAWHAVRFADEQTPEERARYAKLEAEARQAKRGLWAEPDPMPPSECRRLRYDRKKCR